MSSNQIRKKTLFGENTTTEPLIIKNEPIESTETKEEPIELNV